MPINICSKNNEVLNEKDRKRILYDIKIPDDYEFIFNKLVNMIQRRYEQLKNGIHNP